MKYSRIIKDSEFSNIAVKGKVINVFKHNKHVLIVSNIGNISVSYSNEAPEVGCSYFFMIIQKSNISIIKDFIKI